MSQIGTVVIAQETPSAVLNNNNTANAFMVGLTDWGPSAVSANPLVSLGQVTAKYGQPTGGLIQNSRGGTFSTIYDSADAFFREGGGTLFISRVMGQSPGTGTLVLNDTSTGSAAFLTAAYFGAGSGGINVVVNNQTTFFTITLQDSLGNLLTTSPQLTTVAGTSATTSLQGWAATTNLVTCASTSSGLLPKTAGTLGSPGTNPMSTGTSGSVGTGSVLLANYQTALNNFTSGFGPGQVMAPNQNNTQIPGIWSALATHAQANNRIALLDGTDGNTATQAISEVTGAALGAAQQGYCGIWAGNLLIPGITSGTTRTIAPSPVIAALCARADNIGNPNLAAAGTGFPLIYVSGQSTAYTGPLTGDISTLNGNGINAFYTQFNLLQNFGFVSALGTPSNDAIYWQLSHSRLRMAIVDAAAFTAQPFQFAQIDGQGQLLASFGGALSGMLLGFYGNGSLYGSTSSEAFSVIADQSVNTADSLAAGNLIALLAVRMSPFAQLVTITINAIPITQNLVQQNS